MPMAPQVIFPPAYRRPYPRLRRRTRSLMSAFGLVPMSSTFGRGPCPEILQWIPPGCTAQVITDPVTGCPTRIPICPSAGASPLPAPPRVLSNPPPDTSGTPVPSGFPTNQIFVNTDGSQWVYSASMAKWINVGTPYNVGAPVAAAPAPAASAPVSVNVAPAAAVAPPVASPYQSIIDFATQDTLITNVPNWLVGIGVFLGYKLLSAKLEGGKR